MEKKYRQIREKMTSKESTEAVVKEIAVRFSEDIVLDFEPVWRNDYKEFGWRWRGHPDKQKELGFMTTDQLFDYWLKNIYEPEK